MYFLSNSTNTTRNSKPSNASLVSCTRLSSLRRKEKLWHPPLKSLEQCFLALAWEYTLWVLVHPWGGPEILLSYGGHSPLVLDDPDLLDTPEPQCGPKGQIVWAWVHIQVVSVTLATRHQPLYWAIWVEPRTWVRTPSWTLLPVQLGSPATSPTPAPSQSPLPPIMGWPTDAS